MNLNYCVVKLCMLQCLYQHHIFVYRKIIATLQLTKIIEHEILKNNPHLVIFQLKNNNTVNLRYKFLEVYFFFVTAIMLY